MLQCYCTRRHLWLLLTAFLFITITVPVIKFTSSFTDQSTIISQSSSHAKNQCKFCRSYTNLHMKGLLIDQDDTRPFHMSPSSLPSCGRPRLTLVTAFLDIGPFSKGDPRLIRTHHTYTQWMQGFSLIQNPIVAYFNNDAHMQHFRKIRLKHFPESMTKIIKVRLEDLWAFKLSDKIAEVFSNNGYLPEYPNTATPAYTCATHARYELLHRAVKENHFDNLYFSWVDIGYFRSLASETSPLVHIGLPPDFNDSLVAYQEVFPRQFATLKEIFRDNPLWLAGGYFVARMAVMQKWCEQYMEVTEYMLGKGMMNADQPMVYGMVQYLEGRKVDSVRIMVYTEKLKQCPDIWMCLGYRSMCISEITQYFNS